MSHQPSIARRSQGLTVVELLIAVALSLVIMAGAASIFMGSKESFRLEEDLSRHQENLRYISDLFLKDFTMTGFSGCTEPSFSADNKIHSSVVGPVLSAGVSPVVMGTDGGDPTTPDEITVWYALVETVTPVIRSMDYRPELLVGKPGPEAGPIVIDSSAPLYQALEDNFAKPLDEQRPIVLFVSDCFSADMFLATGVAKNPDDTELGELAHDANEGSPIADYYNENDSLSYTYGRQNQSTAYVYRLETVTFSTQAYVEDGETRYNLRARRNSGNAETILSGITNFQVEYGMNGAYVNWDNNGGLNENLITSLRFILTYPLSGKPGSGSDKTVEFVVKLRNA